MREFSRSGPVFLIPQGTLPWQAIKVEKLAFLQTNQLCRAAIQKWIAISQFRVQKIRWNQFLSTLCTILVTFGPETPEFTLLTIAPFVAIRQKSAYHAKYLRIF